MANSTNTNTTVSENGLTLTLGSGALMSANNVGNVTTTSVVTGGTINFGQQTKGSCSRVLHH